MSATALFEYIEETCRMRNISLQAFAINCRLHPQQLYRAIKAPEQAKLPMLRKIEEGAEAVAMEMEQIRVLAKRAMAGE